MNASKKMALTLVAGLALCSFAAPAPTPGYARIAAELDLGGDYLEIVNAATFESDIDTVAKALLDLAESERLLPRRQLDQVAKVRRLVKSAGLLSLRGRGCSVRQKKDGSYVHKCFLLTREGRNVLLGVLACTARPATVESYLPRSTAAALSFSSDVKGTARFVADALAALGGGAEAEIVRSFCTAEDGQKALADGIAPGTVLSVTLDPKKTITLPDVPSPVPAMGILVVQAVNDGQLWQMLKPWLLASAKKAGVSCSTARGEAFPDVERLVFSVPDLKPLGLATTLGYDRKDGVLILASSPDLLDEALAAGRNKVGRLLDEPAFGSGRAAVGEISGIAYLSPRIVPTLADLVRQSLPKSGAEVPPALAALLDEPPALWYAGTQTRLMDGLKIEGRASFGAGNTLRMLGCCGGGSAVGLAGMLAGALFPAVSSATLSANTSAMSMRGRNLFVGIIQANTERASQGLASVWPHRTEADGKSSDADDIAGTTFRSSTAYFQDLFDIDNYGKDDWSPYVSGVDVGVLSASGKLSIADETLERRDVAWTVAAGVVDEMDDCVPVLISANFNPGLLLTKWDGSTDAGKVLPIGPSSGAPVSLFNDKAIVVVTKGGAVRVIKAKYLTYGNLYGRRAFDNTKTPLVYLTPGGVVVPSGARPKN